MKEELPSILISDGWVTDDNDALVEVVIPSTVDTYQNPTKITFLGDTLSWAPTATNLEAPNITTLTTSICNGYKNLTEVSMPKLKSISQSTIGGAFNGCTSLVSVNMPELESLSVSVGNISGGVFSNCSGLLSISLPKLKTIESNSGDYGRAEGGTFYNCTSLQSINFPLLESIKVRDGYNSGAFVNCSSLTSINFPSLLSIDTSSYSRGCFRGCVSLTTVALPKIRTIYINSAANQGNADSGCFSNCTNLTSVQLGSVGHPVTALNNYTFGKCTQSGLTITIYTTNGASLSGSPWGATNATIVYETA